MCRLYSSPKKVSWISEVLGFQKLSRSPSGLPVHGAACAGVHRITAPSEIMPISPTFAFNKDAFPNRRHPSPATNHSPLPKQAQLCCVSFQAQYQAFVRFAVESCTASAIALKRPLRSGTVDRLGSCASGFIPRLPRGRSATLEPMLWPERSRSRDQFQEVFLRSNRTLSGHFAGPDGPWNACQIGFGGLMGR